MTAEPATPPSVPADLLEAARTGTVALRRVADGACPFGHGPLDLPARPGRPHSAGMCAECGNVAYELIGPAHLSVTAFGPALPDGTLGAGTGQNMRVAGLAPASFLLPEVGVDDDADLAAVAAVRDTRLAHCPPPYSTARPFLPAEIPAPASAGAPDRPARTPGPTRRAALPGRPRRADAPGR